MDRFKDPAQLDRLFFQLRCLKCPRVRVSSLDHSYAYVNIYNIYIRQVRKSLSQIKKHSGCEHV